MMTKIGMVAAALALIAAPAFAEQKIEDIQICTGGKDGNYAKVGHMLQEQLRQIDSKHRSQVMFTQGSVQNLRLMLNPRGEVKENWCDVAIVQKDALVNFFRERGEAKSQIARLVPLYTEKVHFLFNKKAAEKLGISRVPDIRGKKVTIAVGTAGSGNNETWKTLVSADKTYGTLGTVSDRPEEALEQVADGTDVQGMIVTSGLKTPFMEKVLKNYGDTIVLLGFNDGDLTSIKDEQGKELYTLVEIPAGMYRAIQPSGLSCMGSCAVKTAEVEAVLIYSKRWKEEAGPDVFQGLIDAKNNIKGSVVRLNDPPVR